VILAHQKLAHCGGPNISNHTRIMVYFRLLHVRHGKLRRGGMDNAEGPVRDLWACFEPVREALVQGNGSSEVETFCNC
jgi:hypothetical protein